MRPSADVRASMTQATYEMLKDAVLYCRLLPGQRLSAVELAEKTGSNVAAVREALSRLTSEGFVISVPQKGFRVAPFAIKDLQDLTDARMEIESLCLQRSVQAGGLDWEARMIAAFHQLSRQQELDARDANTFVRTSAWSAFHSEFHESLVAACDNSWLLRVRAQLYTHHSRYRNLALSLTGARRNIEREHKEILEALLARDSSAATAQLRKHLSMTADAVIEHVKAAENAKPAWLGELGVVKVRDLSKAV